MSDARAPDFAALTSRQQQTWALGDYNVLAMTIAPVAEALVAAADPHAGQRVLDVACGTGNTALVAARRFCDVIGIDYVAALIDRARQRAAAEGTRVEFREGDAQALPFPDAAFDVVLSTFGVIFAPDQEQAASELLRVTRPGGRIGLACWTPTDYGGDFFRTVAKHVPPPDGVPSPLRWGTEAGLRELLGHGTSAIRTERRAVMMYYKSIDHAIEVYRTFFGRAIRAFQTLDPSGQDALRRNLATEFGRYNRASDGTCILEGGYLQTIATRR